MSLEIEQIVLGTILAEPKAMHMIPLLEAGDFDEGRHQLVFQAASALAMENRHPSAVVLAPQFRDDLMDDGATSLAAYLRALVERRTDLDQLVDYCRALKEAAARRMMFSLGQQLIDVAGSPSTSVADFLEAVAEQSSKALSGIRQQAVTSFSIGELYDMVMADLESDKEPNFVRTGLTCLDSKMGGWPRGELSIIAGRTSMGKTATILSGVRQSAMKHGTCNLIFSMEMQGASVLQRMLSDHVWTSMPGAQIPYERIVSRKLGEAEKMRLKEAYEKIHAMDVHVDQQDALSMAEIAIRSRRYADRLRRQGKRLDLIVIDHLAFVTPTGRYRGNRVHEVGEITRAAKALGKELDCAMVVLCQLNREADKRENSRPQLTDLRESGDIEQDADTIVFCYRDHYYLDRMGKLEGADEEWRQREMEKCEYKIELILGKRRNGPIFSATADAFMGSNAIRSLAHPVKIGIDPETNKKYCY